MVKNVLIVDDDREMLLALKDGLSKYKETFSVSIAEDGTDAVKMLTEKAFSLVVTDLKMPQMDGFALLTHIMGNYPDIPVIIITGYSTPDMEKLAREGGAVGYIAKPFMLEDLARDIMATLRKESEGGTLHSVSSGIFLQLMEMEQKTCTIRLEDKSTGKKGVLFFQDGELLDARVDDLQGKPAAYKIFSWEEVNISIQNVCPKMENKIESDLQPLILEVARLKDENKEKKKTEKQEVKVQKVEPLDTLDHIKKKIEKQVGSNCRLEDIYIDTSLEDWSVLMSSIGDFFGLGNLKVCYLDKGESNDTILLPGKNTTVVSVGAKCPKDKIIQVLSM
ncbi:MAG: response regulator [Thermodesulfobacteriota bacterium]|nr:response regulator [Thermodesulfobacteriota bacterium]